MIDIAARQQLAVRAVVFDPAYCALRLLRHLDDAGYHWVSRLSSNRVVIIDGNRFSAKQLSRKWSWFSDDPCRGVQDFSRHGYLPDYELLVQVVVVRKPGVGTHAFVTSLIETPWQEIFRFYNRRRHVEVFHRDTKQFFGLADFRYRDLNRIHNHIALVYLRYLLLALMRLAFPELADLRWATIKRRIIRTVQQLCVRNDRVRILLPVCQPLFRRPLIRHKLQAHSALS